MVTLSVVIPTFQGDPEAVVKELKHVFSSTSMEIIIVDDGSDSAWGLRIQRLATTYDNVSVIRLPRQRGQAYATLAGVASSQAEVVATMDDDGEHPATALPSMASLLKGPVNLVYGITKKRNASGYRRLGTALNNCLFAFCLGKPWKVPVTSFRVFRRDLLLRALRRPVRFPYLSAMLFAAGARAEVYRYPEVPAREEAARQTRYRLGSLIKLYARLVLHWGPLRIFSSFAGGSKEQFG